LTSLAPALGVGAATAPTVAAGGVVLELDAVLVLVEACDPALALE
jgi:hypothetical protein